MNSPQQNQGGQNQQRQQSGQAFGTPTKQNVQTLITQIEASPQGSFTCSNEQAMNTVLPALKTINQQL